MNIVRQAWTAHGLLGGKNIQPLVCKLKHVARVFKEQGAAKSLPKKVAKDRILEQLERLDCLEEGLLDESDRLLRDRLKSKFDEILLREEIYWKQRSKEQWLKKGDRNIAYFQWIASRRKRINSIRCITISDQFLTRNEKIKMQARNFFSKFSPRIHGQAFNS